MRQSLAQLEFHTAGRGLTEITREIASWIGTTGITTGLLTLNCLHTSASLLITENASGAVQRDLLRWLDALHEDDRPRMRDAWRRAVETRAPVEMEIRLHGAAHWHLASIVPDADVEGGCIIAATDISGQKDAQAAAEHASRLKDEFLATVSHELRTPLNAILGWTQNLLEADLDPRGVERGLRAIERNARAQTELIDDILDVSRIVTGKLQLTLEPRAGGCFCEALPDGGTVEHMRVIYADPDRQLRLSGALGPLQGEALAATLTIKLEKAGEGTRLTWSYKAGGYTDLSLAQIAPAVDGVVSGQFARLVRFVEKGAPGAR